MQEKEEIKVYQFPEFKLIHQIQTTHQNYAISDNGKYLAYQNTSDEVKLFSLVNLQELTYSGVLCGLNNYYLLLYIKHGVKTINLHTDESFTLETAVNSINFNLNTLVIGFEEHIKIYRFENESWILVKHLVDKYSSDSNNSNFAISADGKIIAITSCKEISDDSNEGEIEQIVPIYTRIGNKYPLETTLSFSTSLVPAAEGIKQYLKLSDDGRTLIWANRNLIEVIVHQDENWVRQEPIQFQENIEYISIDAKARFLIVVSGGKVYLCN